jgi:hypothetical protein
MQLSIIAQIVFIVNKPELVNVCYILDKPIVQCVGNSLFVASDVF